MDNVTSLLCVAVVLYAVETGTHCLVKARRVVAAALCFERIRSLRHRRRVARHRRLWPARDDILLDVLVYLFVLLIFFRNQDVFLQARFDCFLLQVLDEEGQFLRKELLVALQTEDTLALSHLFLHLFE